MSFQKAWDALSKPLAGNRKGYKRGFKDGFEACEADLKEVLNVIDDLIKVTEPILFNGYERSLSIEKIKEKHNIK